MGTSNINGWKGVIDIIKTPLGFFALCCLIVHTSLCTLAFRLPEDSRLSAFWGLLAAFALLVLMVWLMATFKPQSLGLKPEVATKPDFDSICGAWWELIPNDSSLAVSYFQISCGDGWELHLEGTAYDHDGVRVANWRSQGACYNISNRELFYFWTGDQYSQEAMGKDFSGIGTIRFNHHEAQKRFERGSGWFTIGAIRELKPEGLCKLEIRRISSAEMKQIVDDQSRANAALSAYTKWNAHLYQKSPHPVQEKTPQAKP